MEKETGARLFDAPPPAPLKTLLNDPPEQAASAIAPKARARVVRIQLKSRPAAGFRKLTTQFNSVAINFPGSPIISVTCRKIGDPAAGYFYSVSKDASSGPTKD